MAVFSVLDLAPIVQGGTAAEAFHRSVDLARHAEQWGYRRFWLAEHHSMPGVASAATSVVIAHVAAGTSTIRVGAGGIMLPNHSPLLIAEQFGTLESLYPGRIDLALGRAPGSDQLTAIALRRTNAAADAFPQDVAELIAYFREPEQGQEVVAVPGAGLRVPIWILGSSMFGAQLAAYMGLPFAFASHFAPAYLMPAIETYRSRFQPSEFLERPYLMLGASVIAADSDAEARRLFTSFQQSFISMRRGRPIQFPPPVDELKIQLSPLERAQFEPILGNAIVGSPLTIRARVDKFIDETGANELIISSQIYDHAARLRSYEIVSELQGDDAPSRTV
ncbi:MAG TPA: LLM class flavin-dependent oxidoreductase [Gemmatimonadaceae bacterium]|nr:LLM class flavin-dependent oxidoreductase [Gemmatimonadaceae bacterium]